MGLTAFSGPSALVPAQGQLGKTVYNVIQKHLLMHRQTDRQILPFPDSVCKGLEAANPRAILRPPTPRDCRGDLCIWPGL